MNTVLILMIAISLSGCAAMYPDTFGPEVMHISHASQHFGDHPTNYGYELAGGALKWHRGNFNLSLGEYYNADHDLDGYRETFVGRASYDIPLNLR